MVLIVVSRASRGTLGFDVVTKISLQIVATLVVLFATANLFAQTASIAVRIPRSRINSAPEQIFRFEIRNRTTAAVTVRLASLGVRVAGTTVLHPFEIREVRVGDNRAGRSFTIPAGTTRHVMVETVHRQIVNLPRRESHVVVTIETPDGPVHAEGIVEPIERCLSCRRVSFSVVAQ